MTILQNRILGSRLLFYKCLFLIASFSFRRDVISSVSLSNIFLELFVLFLQLFIFLLQLHFFFSNFFFWYMFIDSRIIIIYIITQRSISSSHLSVYLEKLRRVAIRAFTDFMESVASFFVSSKSKPVTTRFSFF